MSRNLAQGIEGGPSRDAKTPVDAVIALGSNVGDRAATLRAALEDLARLPLVVEVKASTAVVSIAVTPEGPDEEAPAYLNAVAILSTRLAPSVLLDYLHAIENRHGRVRRERWGDRTLDLDLIAYADVTSDDPDLELPHPRAAERDFVLEPWLAVDPDATLPGHGRVDALLARLRGSE
ncbi:2-amino-4-hydroxy-6-hydroxymethyldihydropteridine diphosphokinase [Microbacterium sp. SLBN-146]|uniref:2-amino-4-hydroxy-6- hydroxymethyldihydropteridine diphosphokinase n=1 Tax=Microbacterium sp. SLBN-146 TaxID=2768457 RepID=UPI00114F45AB|nr:2-amino-4-hydroxy-6-hydroxymethyldihydropteridine diphosphokinase [Microbacterium sp. SLBN-146]TQJ30647.1 2-amino-4-hydroxy-6-hydroxymethyldihydropteridine diphosphokinase [Microbacterium sp. SLBN-146]